MTALRALAVVAAAVLMAGCERGLHDMYDQRRYKPLATSPLFADGKIERPQPDDTVASATGAVAGTSSGRIGDVPVTDEPAPVASIDEAGRPRADASLSGPMQALPRPLPADLLTRGRQRYDIYCAPCHSVVGDGDGMVVRRGFPRPSSYHTDRLRQAPDAYFYSVITHGYGAMYPFADRLGPADRWAIVAYVRALQASQHGRIDDVPDAQRATLDGPAR